MWSNMHHFRSLWCMESSISRQKSLSDCCGWQSNFCRCTVVCNRTKYFPCFENHQNTEITRWLLQFNNNSQISLDYGACKITTLGSKDCPKSRISLSKPTFGSQEWNIWKATKSLHQQHIRQILFCHLLGKSMQKSSQKLHWKHKTEHSASSSNLTTEKLTRYPIVTCFIGIPGHSTQKANNHPSIKKWKALLIKKYLGIRILLHTSDWNYFWKGVKTYQGWKKY